VHPGQFAHGIEAFGLDGRFRRRQKTAPLIERRRFRVYDLTDSCPPRRFEDIDRSSDVDIGRFYRIRLAIADAILCGEMEYGIDPFKKAMNATVPDIPFMEFDSIRDILPQPIGKIIDSCDLISFLQQSRGEIRPDKSRDTGNQYLFFQELYL